MNTIIPAIIPQSYQHLEKALRRVETFTRTVQIDIVDGVFVPFISWPYHEGDSISELAQHGKEFQIEVDLMIKNPERVILEYVKAGVKRVIVHLESTEELQDICAYHHKHDFELGLSINNGTELSELTRHIDEVDFVQLMGIAQIGSQGQTFDPRVLERINTIRSAYPDLVISIDGSVNSETLPLLKKAGATRFVSGSAILSASDPARAFKELEDLVED